MLIPIFDSAIRDSIASAEAYWNVFHRFLSDETNRRHVDSLRPADLTEDELPTLRILDTVVWMRYSRGRMATSARAKVGL